MPTRPTCLSLSVPNKFQSLIRTPEEFAEGHVPGAINLPVAVQPPGGGAGALRWECRRRPCIDAALAPLAGRVSFVGGTEQRSGHSTGLNRVDSGETVTRHGALLLTRVVRHQRAV
jgi:hypothetical protein